MLILCHWQSLLLQYAFCAAEAEHPSKYDERLEAMCREIGDRGRPSVVHEGLPPSPATSQQSTLVPEAAAPAPTMVPRPVPAVEPTLNQTRNTNITAEAESYGDYVSTPMTPSMCTTEHASLRRPTTEASVGGLLEVHMALVAKHDATVEKMTELLAEQQLRTRVTPAPPTTEELMALQERLEALVAAELLTEEESYSLDDVLAEYLSVRSLAPAVAATIVAMGTSLGKARQMVDLSAGFAADRRFARQLRRHFLTD